MCSLRFPSRGRFGDALADDRLPDGLGQVTFPAAGWTGKQRVLMAGNERGRCQVKNQAAIHLLVEVKIEVVKTLLMPTEPIRAPVGVNVPGLIVGRYSGDPLATFG
jgi:hypothetical protein